jgi:hypothetical protein
MLFGRLNHVCGGPFTEFDVINNHLDIPRSKLIEARRLKKNLDLIRMQSCKMPPKVQKLTRNFFVDNQVIIKVFLLTR